MTTRILIVEDSTSFRKLIAQCLRQNGYSVFEAWSLESAHRLLPAVRPSIMLLDLGLGDGEGAGLLEHEICSDVLTIVISAREKAMDRVKCLELGAEDYIVKPVDLNEMLLRVRRIEKLVSADHPTLTDFGGFLVDFANRRIVYPDGEDAILSRCEYALLRLLIDSRGQTLPRPLICEKVLKRPTPAGGRAVDVLVSKLRRKLDPKGRASPIWSVRGKGYRFAPQAPHLWESAGGGHSAEAF